MAKQYTSIDIESLLSKRFSPPAWAFLPQVRNGTGFEKRARTADAIAMSLWPSRGLHLNGFEIKVYRSDWLNELKNPAKAEEIAQYCDFWWVAAPKDIVKIDEVPKNWGLLVPYGNSMKILKQAEQTESKNPDKLFLASILRKTQEIVIPDAMFTKKYDEGYKDGKEVAENSFQYERNRFDEFKKDVEEFEKKSGVKIRHAWNLEEIGEAVKMVLSGKTLRAKKRLENLLETAKEITEDIEKILSGKNI